MMHPLLWVAWAAGAAVAAAATSNPFYLAVIAAAAFLVHAAHGRGGAFRGFALAGGVALVLRTTLVLVGPVELGNVLASALEGARLATLLVVLGAFNGVADPFGVLRLAPGRFHEAALAVGLALQIAPRTIAAAGRIREAQRLRGIELRGPRALAALAVPVLASGLEEAVLLAESMDARGHGRGPRTRYRPLGWSGRVALAAGSSVLAGTAFLAATLAGYGDLSPSMLPPRMPGAALPLVAAAALLAVPAFLREGGR
ncbi:MAG: hypothetical protein KatS3mg014_1194 [Actinomycetota bacterium]|nr:MAG: hypothetical protein KatS3mg014_1194 [Actinomycetota bacterium]